MPFIRDNRLAAFLTEAHQRGADQTRRELEGRLDDHLRNIGRRNAELCAEKTELERRLAAAERQLQQRDAVIAHRERQLATARANFYGLRRTVQELLAAGDEPRVSLVKQGPA